MNLWMKISLAVILLLAIGFVAVYFLVTANTFRPLLETELTAALGRPVKLGNLRFSPFTGSLVANDLTIADDPAYSTGAFLTARKLQIGVEMKPLLLHKILIVRSFVAEQPQIHLVQAADGTWNFSSLGRTSASPETAPKKSSFPGLIVHRIAIQHGRAVVERNPGHGPPLIYDRLNLSIPQFSATQQFPFTLTASLPANGEVSVAGNVGPINHQDAASTALDAQISVHHLDPVAAGFLDPAVGVSMLADIDAHAISNGHTLNSTGTVRLNRLQLVKTGSPAPHPIGFNYQVTQSLKDGSGQLQSAEIQTGNVRISISGSYRLVPTNPWMDVKLAGRAMPIDELQALLTSAGVHLPNGSVLRGGTLTIALAILGPANNLVIRGPVAVANTQLVGFDLGSKIAGIAALGGIKTGTTSDIQSLRLDLESTNAGLKTDNIYAVLPAVGEATGSGTVSPSGVLDYRLLVQVTTAQGLGKVGVGLLAKLNSVAGSTAQTVAASGVPMLVTGTAKDPVITADVKGLMQRNASVLLGKAQKNNPGALLKNLFGKKK